MIDFAMLEKLLGMLEGSEANTIEIRKGWWSTTVRVSKGPLGSGGGPVTYQVASGAAAAPAASGGAGESAAPAEAPGHLLEIKSPMVGTFYAQPEPGAEPYVRVGSRVSPGTTLCIIEAMKIMNPLDAELSGVIAEVLVEDAQPVEYGQVLFKVDPNG